MRRRQSSEARKTRYYVRALKRFVAVIFWLFILFLVVMLVIWAVPKVWQWALG